LGAQGARAAGAGEPVAILGAGVSGLTAAYRLKQAGVPFILYEASPRFGGRMFTKRNFNADRMFCELGGELVDTNHTAVQRLARELGVGLQSLAPTKHGVSRNLYYFGGTTYTDAQLVPAVAPLVALVDADLKVIFAGGPRRMITYKDPAGAARWDKMTLREYLDGIQGVDKWVLGAVEMAYVTEYGLDADKQSALNLHMLTSTKAGPGDFELFGDSDEALRLAGGSQRLTDALAQRLGLKDEGAAFYKPGHELVAISDKGAALKLTFKTAAGTVETNAARAVCTIPFSVLRNVDGVFELDMRPQKKASLREMAYGTNSKLMTGFTSRWWRGGESGAPKANGGLFADFSSQSFWDTSRLQKGERGIMTNYTGGAAGLGRTLEHVGASLADLDLVFPGLSKRFDGSKALMNWGRYRYNLGSYICAGPGHYTSHFGSAQETECGGRLFFAGEHASVENGGYMNGGVETGEAAARRVLAARI
jgi:monoamine oxidase